MAKLQQIRRQINLVKQIQHVTNAMKTISAVRLRLGKGVVEQTRTFSESLAMNLGVVGLWMPFKVLSEERILLVSIFSDRGLVGGFNKNIADFVRHFIEQKGLFRVKIAVLGKQGGGELRDFRENIVFSSPLSVHHVPHYADLRDIAFRIMKIKEMEGCTHLYLAFTRYLSITQRSPQIEQALPPQLSTRYLKIEDREKLKKEYLLLGDLESLRRLLEQQYFLGMLYRAVMESFVSEQAARFTIMDAATTHSREIIESLTIFYHKKRQEKITQELNEVTGAAEVLKFS
ncbi:MAG: F0F1 ATP synthase subunit gamma [Candidatus Caldatribacteriaceae bacterium]